VQDARQEAGNDTADRPAPLARIFFDVDDTILSWRHQLRPLTREVLAELSGSGFEVYLWSGRGRRWDVVEVHRLHPFIVNCFEKPLFRHLERLAELGVPLVPDYVVDDHQEVVAAFGGWCVPPPLEPLGDDRHLLDVLHDIQDRYGLPRGFNAP
jgi:hypothetical protein